MRCCWLVVLAWLLDVTSKAQDWPGFRGPAGDGVAAPQAAPLRWDRKLNVAWRVELPLPANGSAIVSNGRVFLTGAEDETGKRRSLYCFDRKDGTKLWARTVEIDRQMPTHATNPYGGSTPAADGERVVVWHASAGLCCYDFAGQELWRRDLGEFRHRWGYGTSPVLHEGKVILHTGPGKQVFVLALELENGKTVWQTEEPVAGDGQDNADKRLMGSWCTPIVVGNQNADADAPRQLVVCSLSTRVVAYDLATGDVVWWCGGMSCHRGDLAYSSPVMVGDLCLVTAGYEGPSFAIQLGGNGDVTETHRPWHRLRQPNSIGSGVAVGDHVYVPDARGFLACIDPRTGERTWEAQAVKGQIWGSIVHAAGRLYVLNQAGTTVVFAPNPEKLEVLAKNELGEQTNSTPAFAAGEVFLRTHQSLWCIAEPQPAK